MFFFYKNQKIFHVFLLTMVSKCLLFCQKGTIIFEVVFTDLVHRTCILKRSDGLILNSSSRIQYLVLIINVFLPIIELHTLNYSSQSINNCAKLTDKSIPGSPNKLIFLIILCHFLHMNSTLCPTSLV